MTQSAIANARLGAKSRTGLLLDNSNENMTGRRSNGEQMEHLKDVCYVYKEFVINTKGV